MERRLAEIPTEEWGDVQVDITPREYVLDYLAHSFPTQLFEPFTDGEGNLSSRPVYRDGQPVQCREAVERRDRLIEQLAVACPRAGRARPDRAALRHRHGRRGDRPLAAHRAQGRPALRREPRRLGQSRRGAGLHGRREAHPGLLRCRRHRPLATTPISRPGTSRLRVHYLLEAGWKADTAIQGLGRTNRTNQAQPPLFRPIATDVKAEKRFLSTIARRLDTLGAITKGQRQTGGQGLFRADDNLESVYGRAALRQLYLLLLRRQGRRLLAAGVRGRHRPASDRQRRQLARGPAADHHLPQSAAGADHRSAEHAVRRVRGSAAGQDRGRHRVGHLRSRRRDAHRREPDGRPIAGRSTSIRRPARRRRSSPSAAASAIGRSALAEALDRARRSARRLAGERAVRPRRGAGPGAEPDARRRRGRTPRPSAPADGADGAVRWRRLAHTHWQAGRPRRLRATPGSANSPRSRTSPTAICTSSPACCCRSGSGCRTSPCGVYRLQTDAGERVIGRLVSPAWVAQAVSADGA